LQIFGPSGTRGAGDCSSKPSRSQVSNSSVTTSYRDPSESNSLRGGVAFDSIKWIHKGQSSDRSSWTSSFEETHVGRTTPPPSQGLGGWRQLPGAPDDRHQHKLPERTAPGDLLGDDSSLPYTSGDEDEWSSQPWAASARSRSSRSTSRLRPASVPPLKLHLLPGSQKDEDMPQKAQASVSKSPKHVAPLALGDLQKAFEAVGAPSTDAGTEKSAKSSKHQGSRSRLPPPPMAEDGVSPAAGARLHRSPSVKSLLQSWGAPDGASTGVSVSSSVQKDRRDRTPVRTDLGFQAERGPTPPWQVDLRQRDQQRPTPPWQVDLGLHAPKGPMPPWQADDHSAAHKAVDRSPSGCSLTPTMQADDRSPMRRSFSSTFQADSRSPVRRSLPSALQARSSVTPSQGCRSSYSSAAGSATGPTSQGLSRSASSRRSFPVNLPDAPMACLTATRASEVDSVSEERQACSSNWWLHNRQEADNLLRSSIRKSLAEASASPIVETRSRAHTHDGLRSRPGERLRIESQAKSDYKHPPPEAYSASKALARQARDIKGGSSAASSKRASCVAPSEAPYSSDLRARTPPPATASRSSTAGLGSDRHLSRTRASMPAAGARHYTPNKFDSRTTNQDHYAPYATSDYAAADRQSLEIGAKVKRTKSLFAAPSSSFEVKSSAHRDFTPPPPEAYMTSAVTPPRRSRIRQMQPGQAAPCSAMSPVSKRQLRQDGVFSDLSATNQFGVACKLTGAESPNMKFAVDSHYRETFASPEVLGGRSRTVSQQRQRTPPPPTGPPHVSNTPLSGNSSRQILHSSSAMQRWYTADVRDTSDQRWC